MRLYVDVGLECETLDQLAVATVGIVVVMC